MPPVTLLQASSLPDILSSGRQSLIFGEIPGVADSLPLGIGGEALTIKKAEVTLPPVRIGQIKVAVLGQVRCFRGIEGTEYVFTAAFYEDSAGGTLQTITQWMKYCVDWDGGTGVLKSEYALNEVLLNAYNTRGQEAYTIKIDGVWPMSITPPASTEDQQAAHVAVEFSMDGWDVVAGKYAESGGRYLITPNGMSRR